MTRQIPIFLDPPEPLPTPTPMRPIPSPLPQFHNPTPQALKKLDYVV